MSSHRWYIATLPVDHINGKMAPVTTKCPDTYDPAAIENPGFWYGYRIAGRSTSRYGIRKNGRNLQAHPYRPAELENRTTFTAALMTVQEHSAIDADWRLMLADFDNQREYVSPRGFAVARCRENDGEWPSDWIA